MRQRARRHFGLGLWRPWRCAKSSHAVLGSTAPVQTAVSWHRFAERRFESAQNRIGVYMTVG
eukprot:8063903-Lingulodinium_polyedra.AAC.1